MAESPYGAQRKRGEYTMPLFRFSMVIDGVERTKKVEIPEHELQPPGVLAKLNGAYRKLYRNNVIDRRMQEWALSKLNLSWEEVKEDDQASKQRYPVAEGQAETAENQRGLQKAAES